METKHVILDADVVQVERNVRFLNRNPRMFGPFRFVHSHWMDHSHLTCFAITLVEIAWTFYMLHGNMQANLFLQNIENSRSLHGNIL